MCKLHKKESDIDISVYSPHDEHRSSSPRPVKLCLDQYTF